MLWAFYKQKSAWRTLKGRQQIKSYGLEKRANMLSSFDDISTVLTLISTHEQSLERKFHNIYIDIGFQPILVVILKLGFQVALGSQPRVKLDRSLQKSIITQGLM